MKYFLIFCCFLLVFSGCAPQKIFDDSLTLELHKLVKPYRANVAWQIYDLKTRDQLAFNQEIIISSASLIKLPVLCAAYYLKEKGKLDFAQRVRFKTKEIVPGSKISTTRNYTVAELVQVMITRSDNTAANKIISLISKEQINNFCTKLKLSDTSLQNYFYQKKPTGRNQTSAQDITRLLRFLYYRKRPFYHTAPEMINILKKQELNMFIPAKLPRELEIAHKTAWTSYACHDAGIVFHKNGAYILVVLTKHLAEKESKQLIVNISKKVYIFYSKLKEDSDA